MKFCANLSFMFVEHPFLERYELASAAGFKAVESGFPFGLSKEEVANARSCAGIEQVLLNIYTGDVTKGELGCAATPGKESQFAESLETSIGYAKALNCTKIHLMSGKVPIGFDEETQAHTYLTNLKYAAGRLATENIIGLIEPINNNTVPNYYMNSYKKGLDAIKSVSSSHILLLLDLFHLQQIQGDVTHSLQEMLPHTGHVQIAQVPNRNEPDSPGELNYRYLLSLLDHLQYQGWVGLEYKPACTCTANGLTWIQDYGYQL